MSKNIQQVYATNPITSNQNLDLMYFGRSPYGVTDDAAMTYANFAAQFLTPTTGVISAQGTANQVLVNGTNGVATSGAITLTTPQDIATTSNPTFASVKLTASAIIKDSAGDPLIGQNNSFGHPAVNYIQVYNAATGHNPAIYAFGTDTNIDLGISTQGTGSLRWASQNTTAPIVFYTGTSNQHITNFNFANTSETRTVTFPDVTGTACLLNASAALPTNGFVPIGDGSTFSSAALTAGTNISISNGSGSITINASGAASFSWSTIAGTTQSAAVQKGYIPTNGSLTTITLPTTFAVGDRISVQGQGSGGWNITAGTGTTIQLGSSATTTGGSLASANRYDSINLIAIVANTTWATLGAPQSAGLTVA